MTIDEWFMTTQEVAKEFGVNPKTVTRWSDDGKIPFVRTPGGQRRFAQSEIRRIQREMMGGVAEGS